MSNLTSPPKTIRVVSTFLLAFVINSLSFGVLILAFLPVTGTAATAFMVVALPFIGIAVTWWAWRRIRASHVVAARLLLATGLLPALVIFVLLLNFIS